MMIKRLARRAQLRAAVKETVEIEKMVRGLRERLAPVEQAALLVDRSEGNSAQVRHAAVLVPVFVEQGTPHLLFIRRAGTLRAHSGEIAFPGGKVDPGDLFPVGTAVREAREEIGLDTQDIQILGLLDPVFTVVSNYLVTPVVAFLPYGIGTLQVQESEVAEVILAPLHALADPAIAHTEQWQRGEVVRTVYFYEYGPYCIWGATGRMLAAFLHLIQAL